jgi:Ca2+-dependent lipid-binding protein
MSSVYVNVRAAKDLHAADKSGTSDPYAVAELVDAATGKPLKKQAQKKTKTAKKTLAPAWDDGEVTWNDVVEDVAGLALRVTVFDADALSSEPLGEALVPLAAFASLKADKDAWYPLTDHGKMKDGTAKGAVSVTLRVVVPTAAEVAAISRPTTAASRPTTPASPGQSGGEQQQPVPCRPKSPAPANASFKRSRIWVNVSAAKDLHAADKSGTSDPYAVAELVDARTGKALKKKTKKLKTKSQPKTLAPLWDDGAFSWVDVDDPLDAVAVRVTVFDANSMSSTALGTVTLPLAHYVAVAGSAEDAAWGPTGTAAWLPLAASGAAAKSVSSW